MSYLDFERLTATTSSTYKQCKHERWIRTGIDIKRLGLIICHEIVAFCYDCDNVLNGKEAKEL